MLQAILDWLGMTAVYAICGLCVGIVAAVAGTLYAWADVAYDRRELSVCCIIGTVVGVFAGCFWPIAIAAFCVGLAIFLALTYLFRDLKNSPKDEDNKIWP